MKCAYVVACRPHDLDEAMHRRITMTFEFRRPDHTQRQQIWRRQLPAKIQRTDDVDIALLALKYELSGGYIRNAVQAALSRLVTLVPCAYRVFTCAEAHLVGSEPLESGLSQMECFSVCYWNIRVLPTQRSEATGSEQACGVWLQLAPYISLRDPQHDLPFRPWPGNT